MSGHKVVIVNNPPAVVFTPQNKERTAMKINTSRKAGFTLVEIMIVVAIIGLLAAIAIPNFVKARNTAQQNACINNLRQIDGAKQQWALENKKTDSDSPSTTECGVYLKNNIYPNCPGGGTYTVNAVSTDPTCSKSSAPQQHKLPNP
jgi:prepilin-type N-terminal cleavage/methylation domain-containing protein